MSAKPTLFAMVTAVLGGDVAGVLYDHEGEPLHSHFSSSEGWLWHDLTTGFTDRREQLEALYPDGYEVVKLGRNATEEDFVALHTLWDERHPGWRDENEGVKP